MNVSAFEEAVLGSCSNDYEAPHTVTTDIARDLGRPITQSEVRAAFLSLAEKGLVDAYVIKDSINEFVPISSVVASNQGVAWFMISIEGRRWCEREAT